MTDQSPVPARTAILPPITDPTVHTEIDRLARRYLNAGGVAMELLNAVGGKAEGLIERLPKPVRSRMDRITLAALNRAFSAASRSRGLLSDRGDWFNRALSTSSGAAGGLAGFAGATVELPVTITLLLRAMLDMAPRDIPPPSLNDRPQVFAAEGTRRKRVALLTGCAQRALNTDINDATIRLLRRHGCEVVIPRGMGCCGALTHHMGRTDESHAMAAANIRAVMAEVNRDGLDAVVINTSGCGTTVKDYGHMFAGDPLEADAARIAALAKDITEVMADLGLSDAIHAAPLRVGYHAACSLQHGQQIKATPKELLADAGFTVLEPKDSHICCGSAGTYNLLQPELSVRLRDRKVRTIEALGPHVVAAGNIGCLMQIGSGTALPVVHTVELLDWATGGPRPAALEAGR